MANPFRNGQAFRDELNKRTGNFFRGLADGFSEGPENTYKQLKEERASRGLDEPLEGVRVLNGMQAAEAIREALSMRGLPGGYTDNSLMERTRAGLGTNPDPEFFNGISQQRLNSDNVAVRAEEEAKLHRRAQSYRETLRANTPMGQQLGQSLGYLGGDLAQDKSRSVWWLLNALQATGRVVSEAGMSLANPNLNTSRAIQGEALRRAEAKGLIRRTGNMPARDVRKNVQVTDTEGLLPEEFARRLDEGPAYDGSSNDDLIYNNPANFEPSHPSMFAKGYGKDKTIHQRRINNQLLSTLGLGATAYAINEGVGLFGRPEGYTAASPDQLDPRDTTSIVDEVATKYILGRPGRMDKDLMELERPDVSPADRVKYQDYLYSKDEGLDLNPFDGDGINVGGVLQTTGDGIHGPEVRFLGRSLGMGEGIMPLAGAIGGVVVGGLLPNVRQIRLRGQRPKARKFDPNQPLKTAHRAVLNRIPEVAPKTFNKREDLSPLIEDTIFERPAEAIDDFFTRTNELTGERDMDVMRTLGSLAAGTIGGTVIGTVAGNQFEDERRRRKFAERFPNVDYDQYKSNAQKILDRKYELIKSNPNTTKEMDQSKVGFNRRNQQTALQEQALEQQALVSQMVDRDLQKQAQQSLDRQDDLLNQASVIDQEIAKRRDRKQGEEQQSMIQF